MLLSGIQQKRRFYLLYRAATGSNRGSLSGRSSMAIASRKGCSSRCCQVWTRSSAYVPEEETPDKASHSDSLHSHRETVALTRKSLA